jgi:hypothetical protein
MHQRLDPFVIHHLGAVELGFEYETLGVHQDVALTPFDLLASVLTALLSAHRGALDRLAIHHACTTGLGIPVQANPKALSNGPVDPLPATFSKRHFLK